MNPPALCLKLMLTFFATLLSGHLAPVAMGAGGSRLIPSGPGPEDLTLINWGGQPALITATLSRLSAQTGLSLPGVKKSPGRLEVHVIGSGQPFVPQACAYPADWVPVGVSAIARSTAPGLQGRQLLYVVNQRPQGPGKAGSVELFEIRDRQIHYLHSLGRSPLLAGANGLIAAPDGSVYVSTFKLLPFCKKPVALTPAGTGAEMPAKPESDTLVSYRPGRHGEAGTWRIVARHLHGANGLALSPDGRVLLCNAYHRRQVLAFTRDPSDGRLTNFTVLMDDLPFGPDNLKPLPDGRYCTAGQRSTVVSALHFATGGLWPTRGDAHTFRLSAQGTATEVTSWRRALRDDLRAPSTVLPVGPHAYIGHILRSGVREVGGE